MGEQAEVIRLALLQQAIARGAVEANLGRFGRMLESLRGRVDIVVLPEMFSTGFMLRGPAISEPHMGRTASWLLSWAEELEAMVCGTIATAAAGSVYNRFYFAQPSGRMDWYDKVHVFSYAGEDRVFSPGVQAARVEYLGWRICPQVCYDIRFPEGARNLDGYDLLLYSANFPEIRDFAWQSLLVARAIENQCYLGACNRVGADENGIAYCGNSQILLPSGRALAQLPLHEDGVVIGECSLKRLRDFRGKYPFLQDI